MKNLSTLLILATLTISGSVQAGIIGVNGGSFATWQTYINNTGNTALDINNSTSLSTLNTLDQVWNIRTTGSTAISDYVLGGGTLVTEWNGSEWALDTQNLIAATDNQIGYVATGTSITFTAAGTSLGMGANTGNPYSNFGSTEFFRSFTSIGAGVDVIATAAGYNVGVAGAAGSGNVVALGWDWGDSANSGITQNLVRDIVGITFSVPAPAGLAILGIGLVLLGLRRKAQL